MSIVDFLLPKITEDRDIYGECYQQIVEAKNKISIQILDIYEKIKPENSLKVEFIKCQSGQLFPDNWFNIEYSYANEIRVSFIADLDCLDDLMNFLEHQDDFVHFCLQKNTANINKDAAPRRI